MILYLFTFLVSLYLMTYLGNILKKIAKEEILELENKIIVTLGSLIILNGILIIYINFFIGIIYLLTTIAIIKFFIDNLNLLKNILTINLIFNFILLNTLYPEYLIFILIPCVSIFILSSITQINKKTELINFLILLMGFIITLLLKQSI